MTEFNSPPSYEMSTTTDNVLVIMLTPHYVFGQNDITDKLQAQRLGISLGIYHDFKNAIYMITRDNPGNPTHPIRFSFLLDDSGSMTNGGRWIELINNVSLMTNIIGHFTTINIHFLNRPGRNNIRSFTEIESCFASTPCGATPMVSSLKNIYRNTIYPHTVLCVFTDGEPSDGNVEKVMNMVRIQNSTKSWGTTFIMCTTEDHIVAQYNDYDTDAPRGCFECIFSSRAIGIPQFDVVDDYESERQEIIAKRGTDFIFDKTTYIAKLALGSIVAKYDDMDESVKINTENIYAKN